MLLNPEVKFATFKKCLEILCEDGYTPYIAVVNTHPDYCGPYDYTGVPDVTVMSLSPSAVRNFVMDSKGISFDYRLDGKASVAYIPMEAIGSIFAKEDTTMLQPFFAKVVDNKSESVKVESSKEVPTEAEAVKPTPAKPVRKGWTPKIIKGGKS